MKSILQRGAVALVCLAAALCSAQVASQIGGQSAIGGQANIQARIMLAITNDVLPQATVGTPYSVQLTATGGTAPYTWLILGGVLPPGIQFNAATGTLSGTPSGVTQTYSALYFVQDSSLPKRFGARAYA